MLQAKAARAVVDLLNGEKPIRPVNPDVLG
jgi:hypothetical protein